MCVQAGFDYDKAFTNTAEVCRRLIVGIEYSGSRVVQHYDVLRQKLSFRYPCKK